MKIILKENIENLGKRGDILEISAGYGRNYLIPRKLALEVTLSNMKMIEMEQKVLRKKLEQEFKSYQSVIDRLNQTSLSFERKAGDKDVIFGSVSTADIKEALDKLGMEIDKKKILLAEPIKRLGNYTVPVKVFHDERAEIKIEVKKEGAEEEEKEQTSQDGQKEEGSAEEVKDHVETKQELPEKKMEESKVKKQEASKKKREESNKDNTEEAKKD